MASRQSTEKTLRVPLVGSPTNRTQLVSKDQRFVNCFPEVVKDSITGTSRIYLTKRFGTSRWVQPASASGEGRGLFAWNSKIYSVIGNKLYETTSAGVSTLKQTLATSTGACGFVETTGTNDYLFVCDSVDGYVVSTTGVVTKITDAQFPTPHVTTPVFLDGYVFLLKTNGDICNSVLEDPLNWDASNFIVPESFPDNTIAIARQNNLVVAIGERSIEYFYDAGNPTGSPLGVAEQYVLQFGGASIGSVCQEEAYVTLVAKADIGGCYVVNIDGVNPKNISTEPINRILDAEGNNIIDCWAFIVRQQGHKFYVLNLPYQRRTLVYDFDLDSWHEWCYYSSGTQDMFPFSWRSVNDKQILFLHETDGYIYLGSNGTYQDNGNPTQVLIQTSRFDGDTAKLKFMSKVEFIADQQTSSSPMTVRYSDDDYKTWSTALTIDLQARAALWRMGSFRRRAFLLLHEANTPLRMEAMEFDLDQGTH